MAFIYGLQEAFSQYYFTKIYLLKALEVQKIQPTENSSAIVEICQKMTSNAYWAKIWKKVQFRECTLFDSICVFLLITNKITNTIQFQFHVKIFSFCRLLIRIIQNTLYPSDITKKLVSEKMKSQSKNGSRPPTTSSSWSRGNSSAMRYLYIYI